MKLLQSPVEVNGTSHFAVVQGPFLVLFLQAKYASVVIDAGCCIYDLTKL